MTEKPILFSGPMVRAILEGRKTQTRRVIKPQPQRRPVRELNGVLYDADGIHAGIEIAERYKRGMRLWVRETWGPCDGGIIYAADDGSDWRSVKPDGGRWKPSIFMPRWASRITLEVTGVRVERVQDISEADAKSEGVDEDKYAVHYYCDDGDPNDPEDFGVHRCNWRFGFKMLWDSINADRGFGWDVNPWVWVIEFRKL